MTSTVGGPMFFHSPDNNILVSDGVDQILMPLADFLVFEPSYVLDSNPDFIWQNYVPSVSWTKHTAAGHAVNFPLPYTNGDTYISKVTYYLANYPLPPSLPEAKLQQISNARLYVFDNILNGGIDYTSGGFPNNFSSMPYSPNALIDYTANGVPGGFHIDDLNGSSQTLTLMNLLAINTGIVALSYATENNLNSLIAAINACTTVPDVFAIDITAGYPTVPYVI